MSKEKLTKTQYENAKPLLLSEEEQKLVRDGAKTQFREVITEDDLDNHIHDMCIGIRKDTSDENINKYIKAFEKAETLQKNEKYYWKPHKGEKEMDYSLHFLDSMKEFYFNELASTYSKNQVGDVFYLQEEFSISKGFDGMDIQLAKLAYAGDFYMSAKYRNDGRDSEDWNGEWREANTMISEFARTFLVTTDVRVERLQDITEDDCLSEGMDIEDKGQDVFLLWWIPLWNATHPEGQKWKDNPYVEVKTVKVVESD